MDDEAAGIDIAVVGMAGRFPGAGSVDAFWENIRQGVESVTRFTDAQLRERGVSEEALADPSYVKAGVELEGMDHFDAEFFGYAPRDAEHLDPQQRIFLECAWEALEHAGYDPSRYGGSIGVYGGCGAALYWIRHLLPHYPLENGGRIADLLRLMAGNSADSLCTRVAYKLNLRGPAVTVQTACSTSLMAVHMACQSLLGYECDMALAGGVSLNLLQKGGYFQQTGAIFSSDGHCRAFDADASGTLLGSGAGIVVLKRLSDARQDGDTIHAVIRGSAANNDGLDKIGFTAPGVNGQAAVIRAAQLVADVAPDTIEYIEAHGTGTSLGDPIEIAGLTQAFRSQTQRRQFCAIGSVKTNLGHLDAAAGIAGLIKTIMALRHQVFPASLNFSRPNPAIDFGSSPFFVNTETRPWPSRQHPRRAGVSSFGIGGTNVHVILEEHAVPEEQPTQAQTENVPSEKCLFLPLSARSDHALQQVRLRLADHIERHSGQSLADIANTLLTGRKHFTCRAAALVRSRRDAIEILRSGDASRFFQGKILSGQPGVAFLFPGQGSQHVDMGRALYDSAPLFRQIVDKCCAHLENTLEMDLRTLIYPREVEQAEAAIQLRQTAITQPALFVIEYALARQWMAWGVQPEAMLGHSIGEYVAACIAGVFTLDDALDLVARRAQLMQSTAPGAMLAVHCAEKDLPGEFTHLCDLAAINAEGLCVLSSAIDSIAAVEIALQKRGVTTQRLHVSHAFHSSLVEPALDDFRRGLQKIRLNKPQIPFVSNVTGQWISAEQACSPEYWVRHLRQTVRFHEGLEKLLDKSAAILLEVGPGETLSTLARRHPKLGPQCAVLSSQCHPNRLEQNADQPAVCAAQLWVAGVELDYPAFFNITDGRRVPLPTYPFERQSYWVPLPDSRIPDSGSGTVTEPQKKREMADWFYYPLWTRTDLAVRNPAKSSAASELVLVLADSTEFNERFYRHLCLQKRAVIWVECGQGFERLAENRYCVRPSAREDFTKLLQDLADRAPAQICHLWSFDDGGASWSAQEIVDRSFHSLVALLQALDAAGHCGGSQKIALTVIANQLEDVTGIEPVCAEKSTLYGPCKVAPQEYPNLTCRVVDVTLTDRESCPERLIQQLVAEMENPLDEPLIALRGPHRWKKTFSLLPGNRTANQRLHKKGVYLITGGTGGIGLTLAFHLARHWQARLALAGRTELPRRESWAELLKDDKLNSALRTKLTGLMELESTGVEVLLLQADVADPLQADQLIAKVEQRFGVIHGVIHAAGEAGGGAIANKTRNIADSVMAPKLSGARNMVNSLAEKQPDFLLLCSSLTALVPTYGQVDYCAANCFLDALACGGKHSWILSVNWDTWRQVGMAAEQNLPPDFGIEPAHGGPLLERLLSCAGAQQLAISRIELAQQFMQTNALVDRLLTDSQTKSSKKSRPSIATSYVAPEGELELALTELWGGFLGISPVGVLDNLFELGGDSLLAIQLLAKVRATYGVDIHPGEILKTPTISSLAELIEVRLIEEIEHTGS